MGIAIGGIEVVTKMVLYFFMKEYGTNIVNLVLKINNENSVYSKR